MSAQSDQRVFLSSNSLDNSHLTSTETPALVKAYLVAYNILSAIGWGYVLVSLLIHLFNLDGRSDTHYVPSASNVLSRWLSSIPFSPFSSAEPLEAKLPPALQPFYQRAQTTYRRVGTQTAFVQSFAILEVIHVILGWVRSPLPTTVAQVASRLFLVWGITEQFVEVI